MFKRFFAVLISVVMIFVAMPNMVTADNLEEELIFGQELLGNAKDDVGSLKADGENKKADEEKVNEENKKVDEEKVNEENKKVDEEKVNEENKKADEEKVDGRNKKADDEEPNTTSIYEMSFNCNEAEFTATVYDGSWNYYYANEDGVYSLPDGSYSYNITKDGFCDLSGNFTVSGENITVDVTLNEGFDVTFNMIFADGIDIEKADTYSVAMYITGIGWVNLKATGEDNEFKYCVSDGAYTYSAYYYYDWNDYSSYHYNYGEFAVDGSAINEDVILGYKTEFVSQPAGAEITVYDKDNVEIKGYYGRYGLENGDYTYKAESNLYKTVNGTFTVNNGAQVITVPMERTVSDDNVNVKRAYFALKGDEDIWIRKTSVKIEEGMTAFDMVTDILRRNGYTPSVKGSYISGITTPEDEYLGEGDRGVYSGWMYSVNDVIPSVSLGDMLLKNGDFVYLFFTSDYTLEKYPESFSGGDFSAEKKPVEDKKDESEEDKKPVEDIVEENSQTATEYLMEKGIFAGISQGEFGEELLMTRAMFAEVIYRLNGRVQINYDSGYNDVDEDMWCWNAVNWVFQSGVMTGYGNGSFGPDDAITKGQAAAVLYRYLLYKGMFTVEEKEEHKKLNNISEEVEGYVKIPLMWAVNEGIMTEDNSKGGITRGYCAEFLRTFADKYIFK